MANAIKSKTHNCPYCSMSADNPTKEEFERHMKKHTTKGKQTTDKKIFIYECGTGNWEINTFKYPLVNRYKKPLFIYPLFEYKKITTYKKMHKEQLAYFEAIKKHIELIIDGIKKSL